MQQGRKIYERFKKKKRKDDRCSFERIFIVHAAKSFQVFELNCGSYNSDFIRTL